MKFVIGISFNVDIVLFIAFVTDGDSEDKWKFQHEAFWMLNEVETPADISSYIIVHCNQTPMMEVTLHTGDMVADVRC